MDNLKYTGIISPIPTPFCEDNKSIDVSATEMLIDKQISDGARGFYILGGTGEGFVMQREEREIMCHTVVEHVRGRVPVINHIASSNLCEAIELAKHAERAGADAIAAIPPTLFGYRDEDIYNYYKALAASVHIPVIVYYFPGAQAIMSAELIAHIFEIDNVTGVKWSSSDLFEMMRLRDLTKGEMNIISGGDEILLSAFAAGADAGIGSTFNLLMPEFVSIYNDFTDKNLERALQTQLKVNRVIEVLIKHELIPSIKYGLELMGFGVGSATYPFKQFTEEEKRAFKEEIFATGWPFWA